MKFPSLFFKRANSKELKVLAYNKARGEIDLYLKYAFKASYVEFQTTGLLERFLDDSEVMYNDTFEMLKDINHNAKTYIDEEDKMVNYSNIALSVVFQDISKKLYLDDIDDYL